MCLSLKTRDVKIGDPDKIEKIDESCKNLQDVKIMLVEFYLNN